MPNTRLLKGIGYEMELCLECGALMRVVQCVLAAEAIRKILEARGEHSQDSPGTRPPARAPPQPQLMFDFVTGFAASAPAKSA